MKYSMTIVLALMLSGCALIQQQRYKAAQAKLEAATLECRAKRLAGELKSFVESAQCSNPQMIAAFREVDYPHMDLINLVAASRLVGAEKVDKGELTEAEFQLQLAELQTRIVSEEQRRNLAAANARSQAQSARAADTAATGVLLQGLKALRPPPTVTCTTFGNITTCN